jgi:hypothetical protein
VSPASALFLTVIGATAAIASGGRPWLCVTAGLGLGVAQSLVLAAAGPGLENATLLVCLVFALALRRLAVRTLPA